MIGPLGRLGAAATLGQHCPQMTQRRCTIAQQVQLGRFYGHANMSPNSPCARARVLLARRLSHSGRARISRPTVCLRWRRSRTTDGRTDARGLFPPSKSWRPWDGTMGECRRPRISRKSLGRVLLNILLPVLAFSASTIYKHSKQNVNFVKSKVPKVLESKLNVCKT